MLEGITLVSQDSTQPDESGMFSSSVSRPPRGAPTSSLSEYQGASYSAVRGASELGAPVVITVFDATNDTSVLAVQSHTVIVTGAVPEDGFVEILERVIVRNDSNLTLTPDLNAEGPAMLSFLRFALPPGAYNPGRAVEHHRRAGAGGRPRLRDQLARSLRPFRGCLTSSSSSIASTTTSPPSTSRARCGSARSRCGSSCRWMLPRHRPLA